MVQGGTDVQTGRQSPYPEEFRMDAVALYRDVDGVGASARSARPKLFMQQRKPQSYPKNDNRT